ncbi:nuclease [Sandaracinobacter sp. RS1-74]|uniref:thermonuclease family protein n=1 Tax=Sandaracinobacteroides sayramensis TaxID=2913411 RepID=UPI001EDB8EFD|nr:nuclease [Sandaracinobacteroides sayramensis]MCG2841246.1 nuclease [Sandaracinobacteroides sayramensis]
MRLSTAAARSAAALAFALAMPGVARADPCTAPLPPAGTAFSGVVRYVGDGDSLCVGPRGHPDRWIEVRLGDFNAPELNEPGGRRAKELLRRVAMGRPLVCKAGRRSYDRVVALCTLGGRAVGEVLRRQGGQEGGR